MYKNKEICGIMLKNELKEQIMELLDIIGIIVIMCGIILIYDARSITKRIFSFSDQNEATFALKIIGFIMSIAGGLMIML